MTRRTTPLFARLLLALVTVILGGCAAQSAFREGRSLQSEGRLPDALGQFERAVQLDPGSAEYRIAYIRARDQLAAERLASAAKARDAGDLAAAESIFRRMLNEPGSAEHALVGLRQLDAQRRLEQALKDATAAAERKDWESVRKHAAAVLLERPRHARALAWLTEADKAASRSTDSATSLDAAYRKTISLEFRDSPLKTVFEVISRSSGLNFVFDRDVRGDQRTSIFLKKTTTEAVLRNLLLTNQLEQRVLDDNSVMIYPNTPAKLKEYQTLVVRSFYLANADAKTVAATLKNLLRMRDPVVDERLNLVIVRDSAEAVRTAERLVALHDVPEPEVMLEVEVLEIKRTRLVDLGVRWPDQVGLIPLVAGNDSVLTLADLRRLNSSRIGAAAGTVSVIARNTETAANLLANPRIRARNREKARIHIGERVPNITTTSSSTGFVAESVTYVDVGLKLDVEPTIYLDNEVAIKVSLEVSNIINQVQTKSGTLAYQLGTRTASTVLRLKDGENQVLAGLISDEDRRTANRVPGLGAVPMLGRLFGNQADDGSKTEIVLSITPRVIRNVMRPAASAQEFDSGTEASVGSIPLVGGSGAGTPFQPPPPPLAPLQPMRPVMPGAPTQLGSGAVPFTPPPSPTTPAQQNP